MALWNQRISSAIPAVGWHALSNAKGVKAYLKPRPSLRSGRATRGALEPAHFFSDLGGWVARPEQREGRESGPQATPFTPFRACHPWRSGTSAFLRRSPRPGRAAGAL